MSNHLIIGLGGTGGKVLREFRKRVYEEFRSNDPCHGVFLDYVYVDSSPADLNDRSGWKVIGKSVHLGEAQKVNINGMNASVLQNLGMYPGIQSFINGNDKSLMDRHMGRLSLPESEVSVAVWDVCCWLTTLVILPTKAILIM